MSVARMSLPAKTASVHEARDHLASFMNSDTWGSQSARDTATLLLSEVVTNAILHVVAGQAIEITLTVTGGQLLAEVHDDSASLPVRRSSHERGGWGLELLELLATRWGVREHPGHGKTVWFEMDDVPPLSRSGAADSP